MWRALGSGKTPGVHWPTGLAEAVTSGSVRSPVSKKYQNQKYSKSLRLYKKKLAGLQLMISPASASQILELQARQWEGSFSKG